MVDDTNDDLDPLLNEAINFVITKQRVSISGVQRQFRIGYNRAAQIVEQMEGFYIVSEPLKDGNREVLVSEAGDIKLERLNQRKEQEANTGYKNLVKQVGGKIIVYQDDYNYGFTGKPKLIIDTHYDIAKYAGLKLGEPIADGLARVYLSLEWRRETVIEFYLDEENTFLHLQIDLPEIQDTPVSDGDGIKSVGKYYYDYCRHVHSIVVRVMSVSFLSCPKINKVIIAGYSQLFNHDTGDDESNYLININVTRDDFEKLNYEAIAYVDPILYLSGLQAITNIDKNHKMNVIDLRW